ncbi:polysaccharide biosynthesis protein [Romboutsia sp. 1001713B170131_170501_G6]|uniref:polysaccharide biosynthesis protein n=1 Tax=Romboutsia sp. 1001713B170131_170501_G6 TaxID=2787108 RepID=UPI0018AB5100|nr:nucleoside-diphosphate sugar epimerase/dehydratase [Romboutsia sp. 1001713B170131_170501_G6]
MEVKGINLQELSLLGKVLNTYKVRQLILWLGDVGSIIIATIISMNLTNVKNITNVDNLILPMSIYIIYNTISFLKCKCYTSLWRYAGEEEMLSVLTACVFYIIPLYLTLNILGENYNLLFYIVNTILIIAFTGGLRLVYRTGRRLKIRTKSMQGSTKVLVVGGGSAGEIIINELKENPQLNKCPIGIIDDDINKVGRTIHNVRILGQTINIEEIVKKYEVDEIILAMASVSNERKKEIIEICKNTKCKLKTIPGIYEIIDGKVDIKKIRDVAIEDLLGREPIKVNLGEMSDYIQDKVVLVTGGGGSIGSELCRQIASFSPKHLIILDNYENNAYAIQQELIRLYGQEKLNLSTIIASIRETVRMDEIFNEYRPEVVFHAAAHKHVPLMEKSPSEAIKNNIFGTKNVAELAHKYKAKRMVLISTDKAVNPTNIMGATKRAAEMIIQTMNEKSETEFVAVRFGNVLGSNGSVIPLFKKQIAEGGPITVTHPDIIRYFMTIPEAVQLVIQAGAMAKGGEIFVLDMGDPVRIVDLAKNLIRLSGFEPDVDIKIEYSGLRPGEKLYEELLMSEEGLAKTENKKIFIGKQVEVDLQKVDMHLEMLKKVVDNEKVELIDNLMREFVSTYIRPEEANRKEKVDEVAITN